MSQKNANAELIGRRYAQAFFSSDVTNEEVNHFLEVAKVFLNDEHLKSKIKALGNARLQSEWVEKLLSGLTLSQKVKNFLKLIAYKGRFLFLKNIVSWIEKQNNDKLGIIPIQLVVSEYQSDEQIAGFKSNIKGVLGKEPIIDVLINPEILGGYIIKTDSVIIDNSLLKRIEKLHNAMKGVA